MIQEIATVIGVTVLIIGLIAGIIGFRPALAKVLSDAQKQVIDTQNLQIEALESRLKTCDEACARLQRESVRLKKELYGVRYVMKDLGYFITLEDDSVSVYDVSSRQQHTTAIRPLHKLATSIMQDEDESGMAVS